MQRDFHNYIASAPVCAAHDMQLISYLSIEKFVLVKALDGMAKREFSAQYQDHAQFLRVHNFFFVLLARKDESRAECSNNLFNDAISLATTINE